MFRYIKVQVHFCILNVTTKYLIKGYRRCGSSSVPWPWIVSLTAPPIPIYLGSILFTVPSTTQSGFYVSLRLRFNKQIEKAVSFYTLWFQYILESLYFWLLQIVLSALEISIYHEWQKSFITMHIYNLLLFKCK